MGSSYTCSLSVPAWLEKCYWEALGGLCIHCALLSVVGFFLFVFQITRHPKGTPSSPLRKISFLFLFLLMLLSLLMVQDPRCQGPWHLNSMFCRMILTTMLMLCWKRVFVLPKRGEWRRNMEETVIIRLMERRVCSQWWPRLKQYLKVSW